MGHLTIVTDAGSIVLTLKEAEAPQTCAHVVKAVNSGVFSNCTFYRSDFVIQFGLHGTKRVVEPALSVNESTRPDALSNTRGAVAVAHWDVPDCGSSEFFISLKDNGHLDQAYGGYAVFAVVKEGWETVDKIAELIASKRQATVNVKEIKYH